MFAFALCRCRPPSHPLFLQAGAAAQVSFELCEHAEHVEKAKRAGPLVSEVPHGAGCRLGCRAPRLVKFSKRPESDRQLRRPYFKRSNSTFPKQHTDKRLSAVFPNFDGAPDLVLCIKAVPDHFDREFPRFRFGLLLTAVYLALLIMQAAAAFYNVEMITWHRKQLFGWSHPDDRSHSSWDCGVARGRSSEAMAAGNHRADPPSQADDRATRGAVGVGSGRLARDATQYGVVRNREMLLRHHAIS